MEIYGDGSGDIKNASLVLACLKLRDIYLRDDGFFLLLDALDLLSRIKLQNVSHLCANAVY